MQLVACGDANDNLLPEPNLICPPGQNSVNGICTPNTSGPTKICQEGEEIVNGDCTAEPKEQEGQEEQNKQDEQAPPKSCPTDQTLVNGVCTPVTSNNNKQADTCNCGSKAKCIAQACVSNCTQNKDCRQDEGETCVNGSCLVEYCVEDNDCQGIKNCVLGYCTEQTGVNPGGACTAQKDCAGGEVCINKKCRPHIRCDAADTDSKGNNLDCPKDRPWCLNIVCVTDEEANAFFSGILFPEPKQPAPPPPPLPTPPPSPEMGAELYEIHCSGCHGILEFSTRKGRTAVQIQAAIDTVKLMGKLKFLTATDLKNIESALGK